MRKILKELDSLTTPQAKGRRFEESVVQLLRTAPDYRHQIAEVWRWNEWPERWGSDTGIDIVVRDRVGRTWAVQAKAYDEQRTVSWHDVSTFVAAATAAPFDHLLLVTTAARVSRHVAPSVDRTGKSFSVLTRDHLLDIELPAAQPTGLPGAGAQRRFAPRPHQTEVIEATVAGLRNGGRGQLLLACGTGKTLTALWVKERLEPQRTLVLVPSLALLSQTMKVWRRQARASFVALPVCSDVERGDDEVGVTQAGIDLPTTTDATTVADCLRGFDDVVVFGTYQSSEVIERALAGTGQQFDLIVFDEAHRATGLGVTPFTRALFDEHIPAARRLFMTATPRVFGARARNAAANGETLLSSMDDEALYGRCLHQLSFAEAIERKLLDDYRVVIVAVRDEDVREMLSERRLVTLAGKTAPSERWATDARALAAHVAVARTMRRYGCQRIVSFHSRVNRARRFAELFPSIAKWLGASRAPGGEVIASHVSGEMSMRERALRVHRFETAGDGVSALLANARCLSEGIDVPAIDAVAFVDPRRSQIDIVQAVGRAIRRSDSSTGTSTIILPVFVDDAEDAEAALSASDFETVWRVLDALRSHDGVLCAALDAIRLALGRTGRLAPMPDKLILDVPQAVGHAFADALSLRIVERSTSPWKQGYGALLAFVEREGHALVPQKHVEGRLNLGSWVSTQRHRQARHELPSELVLRLEALPGWAWSALEAVFQEHLHALQRYVAREGNCRPSQRHVEIGLNLGVWVHGRRQARASGTLPEKHAAILSAVPGWTWNPYEDDWRQGVGLLREFAGHHGHAMVPGGQLVDGFPLGAWTKARRAEFRKGSLNEERRRTLEALPGWAPDVRQARRDSFMSALRAFVAREGHAIVPRGHTEATLQLGNWVHQQRNDYRRGRMSERRRKVLDCVPGWVWEPFRESAERMLDAVRQFADEHGHADVPYTHRDGSFSVGVWVSEQRALHRDGRLDGERKAALEGLPGWSWKDRMDVAWERWLAQLTALAGRGVDAGSTDLRTIGGERLARWVTKQRSLKARNRLRADRAAALELVRGWTWDARAQRTEQATELLIAYVNREGHARVPLEHIEAGFKLGRWVCNRRQEAKTVQLSPDMVSALETVRGWSWDTLEDNWLNAMKVLGQFVEEHGHARVPAAQDHGGFALGPWVTAQRGARRAGRLLHERVARLEAFPGWVWDAREARWADAIAHLHAFTAREGHARVPVAHRESGHPLGRWVNQVRTRYGRGKLRADRVAELESVGGWTWSAR